MQAGKAPPEEVAESRGDPYAALLKNPFAGRSRLIHENRRRVEVPLHGNCFHIFEYALLFGCEASLPKTHKSLGVSDRQSSVGSEAKLLPQETIKELGTQSVDSGPSRGVLTPIVNQDEDKP